MILGKAKAGRLMHWHLHEQSARDPCSRALWSRVRAGSLSCSRLLNGLQWINHGVLLPGLPKHDSALFEACCNRCPIAAVPLQVFTSMSPTPPLLSQRISLSPCLHAGWRLECSQHVRWFAEIHLQSAAHIPGLPVAGQRGVGAQACEPWVEKGGKAAGLIRALALLSVHCL